MPLPGYMPMHVVSRNSMHDCVAGIYEACLVCAAVQRLFQLCGGVYAQDQYLVKLLFTVCTANLLQNSRAYEVLAYFRARLGHEDSMISCSSFLWSC